MSEAIMTISLVIILWAWFRFRQSQKNKAIKSRVTEDQWIIGDGFYRIHQSRWWFIRKIVGARFEYLNPLDITMDLDSNGRPKQYRYKRGPVGPLVHRRTTKPEIIQ